LFGACGAKSQNVAGVLDPHGQVPPTLEYVMRRYLSPILFSALAAVASAQSFECSPANIGFPVGNNTNCENAKWNGVGPFGGAVNAVDCGMPAAGSQYGLLYASGPIGPSHPANTLPARPLAGNVGELKFDVPEGATALSLRYNFLNTEAGFGSPTAQYNDGMEIAICDYITGARIQSLAYVDTFSPIPSQPCNSTWGGIDTQNPGVDTLTVNFGGPMPAGLYLSIACWNSGDDGFDSAVVVDCINWGNSWELGPLTGPRVVDTTVGASFLMGGVTSVQTRAGLPYIEGFHCMVAQFWDGNLSQQWPGIAGDYWICTDRPMVILSEGLLTGGVNPGRGQNVSFVIPNSGDLCGRALVVQSYVITELITNPSFTTALFGWIR